jgi:ABC-type uncharacterized transport system permease subunit
MSDEITLGSVMIAILAGAVRRGTPIAYAAMGEAIAERSGIINLGVEGMMIVGAMVSVAVQLATGNPLLALLAAGLAAMALASIHAILVIWYNVNQIVSGFALTILGTGLSGFFGRQYIGIKLQGIDEWDVPLLSGLPVVGKVFFQHDPLVYLSVLVAIGLWFLVYRTHFGLNLRAIGEDPAAAHARGVRVQVTRLAAVLLGGFLAGIGGAHLAIAYTQLWAEKMTSGQGWIAVGLVIVAGWNPGRALVVAWAFGALTVLHPHLQAWGVDISPYVVAIMPYAVSIMSLVVATLLYRGRGYGLPAALAKQFRLE